MGQSVTDACNSALQQVGAASILNILDNSKEARVCNVAFDSNRRDELRKHFWNFAIKREVLAADVVAPAFGYAYAFTLPSDCLRIRLPNDSSLDWKREGNKILTNTLSSPYGGATSTSASLSLQYVYDVTDVTQWDASFYNVFCISLALDICEALTNSNPKRQALQMMYRDAVSDARRTNAFETLPQDAPDDYWWTVRG